MKTFREWLQNNKQKLHEVVQTVGTGTVNYFAKNILADLQKPDIRVGRIKGWIYEMLTRTPEVADDMIPQGYAEKYMVNLPKIPVPNHTKVIESGGFVHFTTNTNRPNRQRIGDQNEAKVTLKQYFSLNTAVENLKETLNHLFRNVPVLAVELHKIAVKNNDQINFKIPDQLYMFMEHPDTIVVHYYNQASGPEIRQVVDRLFPDQADRGLRVKSGFDVNHPSLQNSGTDTGGSHTELIAWAVAGTIIGAKDKVLSKYDANSFGQKLLEVVKMFGEMDQRTLYAAYLKAQKLETPMNQSQRRNSLQVMNDLIAAFKIGKVNKTQANQEVDRLVDENPEMDRSAFVSYINGVLGSPVVT